MLFGDNNTRLKSIEAVKQEHRPQNMGKKKM
jgi:hypothetical protein